MTLDQFLSFLNRAYKEASTSGETYQHKEDVETLKQIALKMSEVCKDGHVGEDGKELLELFGSIDNKITRVFLLRAYYDRFKKHLKADINRHKTFFLIALKEIAKTDFNDTYSSEFIGKTIDVFSRELSSSLFNATELMKFLREIKSYYDNPLNPKFFHQLLNNVIYVIYSTGTLEAAEERISQCHILNTSAEDTILDSTINYMLKCQESNVDLETICHTITACKPFFVDRIDKLFDKNLHYNSSKITKEITSLTWVNFQHLFISPETKIINNKTTLLKAVRGWMEKEGNELSLDGFVDIINWFPEIFLSSEFLEFWYEYKKVTEAFYEKNNTFKSIDATKFKDFLKQIPNNVVKCRLVNLWIKEKCANEDEKYDLLLDLFKLGIIDPYSSANFEMSSEQAKVITENLSYRKIFELHKALFPNEMMMVIMLKGIIHEFKRDPGPDDIESLKEFIANIKDDEAAIAMIENSKDIVKLEPRDILELSKGRLSSRYESIQDLLEKYSVESSIKPESLPQITGLFKSYSNLKLSDIFFYYSTYGNFDEFLKIVKDDILLEIKENFKPSKTKAYFLEAEGKNLTKLADHELPKVKLICDFLLKKTSSIPKFTKTQVTDYHINFDGCSFIGEDHRKELDDLFNAIIIEPHLNEERVIRFFETLMNLGLEAEARIYMSSANGSKLFEYFRKNKNEIMFLFQQKDGLENFLSAIQSLPDGCIANLGNQFSIIISKLLITDPIARALNSCFIDNISTPILNSGGDIMGIESNPLKIIKITSSYISPPGLFSALTKSLLKENGDPKEIVWEILRENCKEMMPYVQSALDPTLDSNEYSEDREAAAKLAALFIIYETSEEIYNSIFLKEQRKWANDFVEKVNKDLFKDLVNTFKELTGSEYEQSGDINELAILQEKVDTIIQDKLKFFYSKLLKESSQAKAGGCLIKLEGGEYKIYQSNDEDTPITEYALIANKISIIENSWLKPESLSVATTAYSPFTATGYYKDQTRGNNFTVKNGIYEDDNAINQTMLEVIMLAALDAKMIANLSAISIAEIQAINLAIEKIKERGGATNQANKDGTNIKLENLTEQEKNFSGLIQEYNKMVGIFSGRKPEERLKGRVEDFGLRAVFLPKKTTDALKKMEAEPFRRNGFKAAGKIFKQKIETVKQQMSQREA